MLTQRDLTDILKEYCFKNIWNDTRANYRTNIKLSIANGSRSAVYQVQLDTNIVKLPTDKGSYFIYTYNLHSANSVFNIERDAWYSLKEIGNTTTLSVECFSKEGKVLPKDKVFVMLEKKSNLVILAANKASMAKCGMNNDTVLYLRYYIDSDIDGKRTIFSMDKTTPYQEIRDILFRAKKYNRTHQVICYINGIYNTVDRALDVLGATDEVDITIDEDIKYEVEVDTSNTYFSSMDKVYKTILHIPKEKNVDNKIITYDTCSLFCVTDEGVGTYMHYVADNSIVQLSHSDLGVSNYILDAHRDYLNNGNIKVVMKVRTHEKDKVLIRNGVYLDVLYQVHDDKGILEHLTGKVDKGLFFWTASHLEEHPFVRLMYKTTNDYKLVDYIKALGYYNVANLICSRVKNYGISPYQSKHFDVDKPLVWRDRDIHPLVFINGTKVHTDKVHYTNYSNFIRFTLDSSVQVGDVVSVMMLPIVRNKSYYKELTEDSRYISVPSGNITLYKEVDYSGSEIWVKSMYAKTQYCYEQISFSLNELVVSESNDITTFNFSDTFNKAKVFVTHSDSLRIYKKNLKSDIDTGKCFIVDLNTTIEGYDKEMPLMGDISCLVFFNGKYLTENLDYKLVRVKDWRGEGIGYTQVVITNMTYGRDNGENEVEVIVHPTKGDIVSSGFIVDDVLVDNKSVYTYFDGLTSLFIDGELCTNSKLKSSTELVLPTATRQGALYALSTEVPTDVKELLDGIDIKDDDIRIRDICNYTGSIQSLNVPESLVLNESHRVYSAYLNYMITGIVDGSIPFIFDADDNRMLTQLKYFDDYKKFDIIFNNTLTDRQFIDIYPVYKEIMVADKAKINIIKFIVKNTLEREKISSGVVLDNIVSV